MEKFQSFLSSYPVRRFDKGEIILSQSEVPSCVYVIKKGVVKMYNLTMQGEEKPIMFDIQDEIFPVEWVFRKVRYAQYFYEAFTDVEVYCVPAQEFHDYLHSNTDYLYDLFSYLIGRYINYQMRINALEQSKASAKIINTIHFLCLCYGVDIKKDVVQIRLPLTQQDLANFMGLTRETTGIELKKLQRQGVLTYRKQNYVVATDKLNDLLDEEYDQGRIIEEQSTLANKLNRSRRP